MELLELCNCNALTKSGRPEYPGLLVRQQMAARKEEARGGKYLCYVTDIAFHRRSSFQPPSVAFSPGEFTSSDQVTSGVSIAVVLVKAV